MVSLEREAAATELVRQSRPIEDAAQQVEWEKARAVAFVEGEIDLVVAAAMVSDEVAAKVVEVVGQVLDAIVAAAAMVSDEVAAVFLRLHSLPN